MNGIEEEFGDQIAFHRLDASQPDIERFQRQLGLRGHPTVAIIDERNVPIQLYFGAQTPETLQETLGKLR